MTSKDEGLGIGMDAAGKEAASKDGGRGRSIESDRRKQIIIAAVSAIACHGLHGATNRRIAERAGISPPTLYLYFENQQDILCAAMDLVADRVFQWLGMSSNPDVIERLREIGRLHGSFMAAEFEGFVVPSFEFITSAQELELRRRWGEKQRGFLRAMADMIEEGKAQGTVRQGVDAEVAAWQFIMFAMLEDISRLTGRDDYITDSTSIKVLDQFLAGIADEVVNASAESPETASSKH